MVATGSTTAVYDSGWRTEIPQLPSLGQAFHGYNQSSSVDGLSINNHGIVIGDAAAPGASGFQAFLALPGGWPVSLWPQAQSDSINTHAISINNHDHILIYRTAAGYSIVSSPYGFTLSQPPGGYSNTDLRSFNAINDADQVVGSAWNSSFFRQSLDPFHAILWKGNDLVDLNTLIPPTSGLVLTEGIQINNNGQILVNGTLDGKSESLILTPAAIPIPEPATAALAPILAAWWLAKRRSRKPCCER